MRGSGLRWDLDPRNSEHFDDDVVNVPCRRCIGCNQKTQREWAIRGFHEAQLHTEFWQNPDTKVCTELPNSSVVTLTYDDEHLPEDRALRHRDFQNFMKRLRIRRVRRWSRPGAPPPIRYFMAGEYGGRTHRPHYHAVIFGESFDDSYLEQSADGQVNRMSYELDELWSQPAYPGAPPTKIGRATVDSFTFAGASYVAGYVAKKAGDVHLGPLRESVDQNGVVTIKPIAPEYRKMSTRLPRREDGTQQPGGLGGLYLERPGVLERIYEADAIKISEWTFHPPAYYDTLLSRIRPDLVEDVKARRLEGMSRAAEDWSEARCTAAEKIALSSLSQRRDLL